MTVLVFHVWVDVVDNFSSDFFLVGLVSGVSALDCAMLPVFTPPPCAVVDHGTGGTATSGPGVASAPASSGQGPGPGLGQRGEAGEVLRGGAATGGLQRRRVRVGGFLPAEAGGPGQRAASVRPLLVLRRPRGRVEGRGLPR